MGKGEGKGSALAAQGVTFCAIKGLGRGLPRRAPRGLQVHQGRVRIYAADFARITSLHSDDTFEYLMLCFALNVRPWIPFMGIMFREFTGWLAGKWLSERGAALERIACAS